MINFKTIHIGQIIEKRVKETDIDMNRICRFLKCTEDEVKRTYISESIESYTLLRWSKLLEYDFFRLYSQHLILYSPSATADSNAEPKKSSLPKFKKRLYTKEIIDFILELIESRKMTKDEVMAKYRIPKTTLYRWISKYKN